MIAGELELVSRYKYSDGGNEEGDEIKKSPLEKSVRHKPAFDRDKKSTLEEEKRQLLAEKKKGAGTTMPAAASWTGGVDVSTAGSAGGSAGGGGLSAGAAGGAALPTSRGMSGFGMMDGGPSSRRFFSGGGNFQNKPPSVPREPAKQHAWLRHPRLYLVNEGLEYTLSVDPAVGPVCVVGTPRSELLHTLPLNIIEDHTIV